MSDIAAPICNAPILLWRIARAFLCTLHALFGSPADVAERHTLRYEHYALLASWLRCAEALLRHLLLIEAAAYPKPNTRPLLHPRRRRVRKPMGFSPETPEAWRVTFRCFSDNRRRARKPAQRRTGPRKRVSREDRWSYENFKPVKFRSAWPLAERYEALIRVFNNPVPYARRLAGRLHATPHRGPDLLRAPPEAEHRIEEYKTLRQTAHASLPVFGLDTS